MVSKKAALVKRAAAQQARRAALKDKEPAAKAVRVVAIAKPVSLFQDQKAAQKKKPRLSKMAALSPVEREVSSSILGCQQQCKLCCISCAAAVSRPVLVGARRSPWPIHQS